MSNEITVKLTCSIEELCNLLENKNFRIVEKYINCSKWRYYKNGEWKRYKKRKCFISKFNGIYGKRRWKNGKDKNSSCS